MGRTYAEWEATQDSAMVAKVRAGDEANKVLLNQINWMWVANLWQKNQNLILHPQNYWIG